MTETKNNTETQNKKLCKWCDNPILSPYAKKFCSTSCCIKSQEFERPKYTRIGYCANETCGKVFSKQNDSRKKYCSHSCAAKISNAARDISKPKKYCQNCNLNTIPKDNEFCTSKCFHEYQEKLRIKNWLETGNFGKQHSVPSFVRKYLMREQGNKCAICGCPPFWNGKKFSFRC